jgi:murein DD-endopeptidase MepM/ murein hydrolase activator NlpD
VDADVRARVVTPTCGVRLQCNSHGASSPAPPTGGLSPVRSSPPTASGAVDHPDGMRPRLFSFTLLALLVAGLAGVPSAAGTRLSAPPPDTTAAWRWPTDPLRVVARYDAPEHRFGAGHRGMDLAAASGNPVFAPADGIVVFAGTVVDRGVVTIDHGDGHVTSFEPVTAVLPRGAHVDAGDEVARADAGGHAPAGAVHLGVRLHGAYIDPAPLFGGIPRAVLLPCC